MNNTTSLPWVEKYRPDKLDDIISHREIINTLTNFIANNKIPHMIFYGPPGTGKTTTILACAKKIYGRHFNSMILELNGSDDRGINVVREQIKNFSATDSKISSMIYKSDENTTDDRSEIITNIKLVILDEADAMTYDAQFALRRVIELYTNSTRFCLICNYLTKIIPAIQSRCQMFRFAPISNKDHLLKIQNVIQIENINIEDTAVEKIIQLSEGDMRKSLNLLQSQYMIYNSNIITLNLLYKSIGYLIDEEREEMMNSIQNCDLMRIYNILNRLQSEKNLSNQDIVREITLYYAKILQTVNVKLNNKSSKRIQNKLLNLFDELANIEINLITNTNSNIHLLAISSIIYNYNK
jgi:replication factor C subunit 3/5